MVIVNNDNYYDVVLNSDKLVVADFYADWCGPCRVLGPVLEGLEANNPDVVFVKIDIDDAGDIPIKNGIRSVPTVLFFKDGKEVDKSLGSVPAKSIQGKIDAVK